MMKPDELRKFLIPLVNLGKDNRSLRSFKGNVGVFRNESDLRIINIPVSVEPICVVADTFHTKPLLRWMQQDQEFLFVYIGNEYANLFWGNMTEFNFIDTLPLHNNIDHKFNCSNNFNVEESKKTFFIRWLNGAIAEINSTSPSHLFVGSEHQITDDLISEINHQSVISISDYASSGVESKINFYRDIVRKRLESFVAEKAVYLTIEYAIAEKLQMTETELSEIGKLAVNGRIETLFIADDREYFGRINKITGEIKINPIQTNHHDDCVLDDIAQLSAINGARVVVTDMENIPGKNPAAAIIKSEPRKVAKYYIPDPQGRRA